MSAKKTLPDLVGKGGSSNFKQVVNFLVSNIYFTFFLSVVDWTFYKSNCILLLRHVRLRSSRQEVFCKRDILRNFAIFTEKHLCHSLFFKKETLAEVLSFEFSKISNNTFSYRTPPVATSGISEWIYTLQLLEHLARNRRSIWSLSEK